MPPKQRLRGTGIDLEGPWELLCYDEVRDATYSKVWANPLLQEVGKKQRHSHNDK